MDVVNSSIWIALFVFGLVDIAAIVGGLLIFLKGRDHVRKKYGKY